MKRCSRGFLMVENRKTGEVKPFFIKVREEDIIWKDQVATRDDIVETNIINSWLCETHSYLKRIILKRRLALPELQYVGTRKVTSTVTLPKKIKAETSVIHVIKESSENRILENSIVEGQMISVDDDGLSNTMRIVLASPNGEFTNANVSSLSCFVNIVIDGFYE